MWRCIIGCVVLATLAAAQAPTAMPIVPVPADCTGAAIVRGFGYISDPSRCDCWIRCTYDDSQAAVKAERECCGCGMFWDQNVLTCFPARDVTCAQDQCAGGAVSGYSYPNNCRTYFTCDGGRTSGGACCNVGQRYDGNQCVPDNTCTDDCLCVDKTTLIPPTCAFRPNPADANTYFEDDNGVQIVRPCPPGSSYNATACKCSTFVDTPQPACPADFNMICDSDPLVDSANDIYIMNNGVGIDLVPDTCSFDGSLSNLLIPRYAAMDFRDSFAVFVAFNGGNNQNSNAPLFSNSACEAGAGPASISIKLSRFNNAPNVEFTTRIGGVSRTIRATYQVNNRNNVYAYYDGAIARLCVVPQGGTLQDDQVDATGQTDRVKCSVRVGADDSNNNYQGVIYSTRVYIFCVPNQFCSS